MRKLLLLALLCTSFSSFASADCARDIQVDILESSPIQEYIEIEANKVMFAIENGEMVAANLANDKVDAIKEKAEKMADKLAAIVCD
ncbi:MAG: hypothetical protein ACI9QD_000812 [Thermoproteota archaeon]|jgi:uncharacterized protein YuzB (UPF0349 family)